MEMQIIHIVSLLITGISVDFASGLLGVGGCNFLQLTLLERTSVPMAQAGVRVAHKLPARELKYIFIAVMFYISPKMTGVFSWFHLLI